MRITDVICSIMLIITPEIRAAYSPDISLVPGSGTPIGGTYIDDGRGHQTLSADGVAHTVTDRTEVMPYDTSLILHIGCRGNVPNITYSLSMWLDGSRIYEKTLQLQSGYQKLFSRPVSEGQKVYWVETLQQDTPTASDYHCSIYAARDGAYGLELFPLVKPEINVPREVNINADSTGQWSTKVDLRGVAHAGSNIVISSNKVAGNDIFLGTPSDYRSLPARFELRGAWGGVMQGEIAEFRLATDLWGRVSTAGTHQYLVQVTVEQI